MPTWTNPRTWTDGELVTAALLNTHVRDNQNATMHLLANKTADEIVNNSTTLQNDDALFFAVGNSERWYTKWVIHHNAGSTAADLKFAWTYTATQSSITGMFDNVSGTPTLSAVTASGSTIAIEGLTTAQVAVFHGIFVGTTAGNIQFQWAQNTLTVVDSKVLAGSCVFGMKLS